MFRRIPFDKVNWLTSSFLIGTFLISLTAIPIYIWRFGLEWFQAALFLVMLFAVGFSVTLGYHRLYAHRTFQAHWIVRLFTLIFGAAAFENSVLLWACEHRAHHKHVDHEDDPYNIREGLFQAHIGWLLFKLKPCEALLVRSHQVDDLDALKSRLGKEVAACPLPIRFSALSLLPAIGTTAHNTIGQAFGLRMKVRHIERTDRGRSIFKDDEPQNVETTKRMTLEEKSVFEDQQLINGVSRRLPDALERLYRRYRVVLRSIIMQVLHDKADADDVLQEVFLLVWDRAASYSADKGNLMSWLCTLARRRAIDRLRQKTAYRRATDRFEVSCNYLDKGVDNSHTVEREAFQSDLRLLLHQHLVALPPHQQEVIRLAFFEEKSQREISALIQTPLGTVKTRIELGIKKLSHALGGLREKLI